VLDVALQHMPTPLSEAEVEEDLAADNNSKSSTDSDRVSTH
jgi:hypothetical protein